MKILGGRDKGQYLKPGRAGTRPTKGLVRGAIFNVLAEFIPGARVLDLFAGSGAMGLEALSRGAAFCTFVDRHPRAARENAIRLGLQDRVEVLGRDFRSIPGRIRNGSYDLIFLDPPYGQHYLPRALQLIVDNQVLAPRGMIVAEYRVEEQVALPEGLVAMKEKRYGSTVVAFIGRQKEQ